MSLDFTRPRSVRFGKEDNYESLAPRTAFIEVNAEPVGGGNVSGGGTYFLGEQATVKAVTALPTFLDTGVDFVFVVDESPSMDELQDVIADVTEGLEDRLKEAGIGAGQVMNRYAVVAFGSLATAAFTEIDFGSYDALIAGLGVVGPKGGQSANEDAYEGIDYAINNLAWRELSNVSKVIFFITDEDRNVHNYADGADQAAQFLSLKAEVVSGGFVLAGLCLCGNIVDSEGRAAIAQAPDDVVYVPSGTGGYYVSEFGAQSPHGLGETATYPTGTSEEYYALLADSEVRGYVFDFYKYRHGSPGYAGTSDPIIAASVQQSILASIVPALADRIRVELVWNFVNWTEDGSEVSTSQNYSFTISQDRILTAHFVAPGLEEDEEEPSA